MEGRHAPEVGGRVVGKSSAQPLEALPLPHIGVRTEERQEPQLLEHPDHGVFRVYLAKRSRVASDPVRVAEALKAQNMYCWSTLASPQANSWTGAL